MAAKDFYQVLGVPDSASQGDIKKAYRRLAKQYHPDANPNNAQASERFKEISEAHSILSDPDKRIARSYGVIGPMGLVRRSIFLVDGDGVLRHCHVAMFGLTYQDVGALERAVGELG